MRCASCGAPLIAGAGVCGVCGVCGQPTPAPQPAHETPSARTPAGLPVGRYQPSSYGPPVRPDVVPRSSEMEPEASARRAFGYRPVELPPPPRSRRGSPVRTLLRLCLLLLLLGIIAAATAYVRGDLPLRNPLGHGGANGLQAGATHIPATSANGTTVAAACPSATVDATAARALEHVQLTTGLRDAAAHDYRPVDNVSAFAAGQTGYVTFQIATGQAGTVGVLFCTPATHISGTLDVPAESSGRYGEFAASFSAADPGQGRLTLTWNGAVAADLPFTVTR